MKNLDVVNLYQTKEKSSVDTFLNNVDANLHVKTELKTMVLDTEWIEKMEEVIPYIDNIFRAPNRFIVNEEEIVKVELARRVTVETIQHLCRNTNFIQSIDEKTGDVRPSKLLNINKEESYDTYENKLIYTLVQNMKMFLNLRKAALEQHLTNGKIDNKELTYVANSKCDKEDININMTLNSKLDSQTSSNNMDVTQTLQRIETLEQRINDLTTSDVYKIIDKLHITLVKDPIKKTNVILKNVNFQYAMKMWTYLRENFDEKTTELNDKKDYEESGNLRKLFNETFMLQYLAMKTLDEEFEDTTLKTDINEMVLEQAIDKMLDMNMDLSSKELSKMLLARYEEIKYKKLEVYNEIQKIFKKHIDKTVLEIEKKGISIK